MISFTLPVGACWVWWRRHCRFCCTWSSGTKSPKSSFPAVRYLEDATRDQQRRLKFRHWLLLIVRTLLIVALVFAAAGATMRRTLLRSARAQRAGAGDRQFGGERHGDRWRAVAGRAGARRRDASSTAPPLGDRVWLIAADGVARAGTPPELRRHLAALRTEPVRLDLGRAVGTGRDLVRGSKRPGEVVVVSALQRSALGAARGDGDVLVVRPGGAAAAPIAGITTLTGGIAAMESRRRARHHLDRVHGHGTRAGDTVAGQSSAARRAGHAGRAVGATHRSAAAGLAGRHGGAAARRVPAR